MEGGKLVPREAPLLVLWLGDDLALVVLLVVLVFAVPGLSITNISFLSIVRKEKDEKRNRKLEKGDKWRYEKIKHTLTSYPPFPSS